MPATIIIVISTPATCQRGGGGDFARCAAAQYIDANPLLRNQPIHETACPNRDARPTATPTAKDANHRTINVTA